MHMSRRLDKVTRGTSQGTELGEEGYIRKGKKLNILSKEDEMIIMDPSDRSSLQGYEFGRHRLIDGYHFPISSLM